MFIFFNPVALRLRVTQCLSVPSVPVIYKSERISLSVSLPPSGPPNRRRQGLQKSPSCLFEFRDWDKSSLLTSSRPPGMCKRSPLIFQHPAWPFCTRSLLPSPPWLLKSFYLHVSRLSEYLTSTADITWKRKQIYVESLQDLSVMNEITRMRLFFQYKYLMNHILCFLFLLFF